ncbi:Oxr1p [Ascoidea rubescens DSM 1968]|uniref:Oxidation resistance protein 1 n=1 Tax=Ascoidea rubescens DSM 1968 TaxID=1344418 RepID=A0A1D2VRT8_9ASCO|nr:TLD-domain-containing protein [Ascoidea rubescens DSM 1968]ODV64309.1 TLD-domain-containing protein [Ascoidea rubescens DSM 1968]
MSYQPPPLDPISLKGYKLKTKNHLMSQELAEELRNMLTPRLQLYSEWQLVYSLEQNGSSLNTLYNNCEPGYNYNKKGNFYHDPLKNDDNDEEDFGYLGHSYISSNYKSHHKKNLGFILVIKDQKGNLFGCFSNEHFHLSDITKRFYGNGECFLWKSKLVKSVNLVQSNDPHQSSNKNNNYNHNPIQQFSEDKRNSVISFDDDKDVHTNNNNNNNNNHSPEKHLQLTIYPYTGLNDFIIYSTKEFLAMGVSGGHYGLWIDNNLINGISEKSMTFGNEPLSDASDRFKIYGLEVWKVGPT